MSKSNTRNYGSARLFLVRVLLDETGVCNGLQRMEWRGRVQYVVTGEAYDFQGWAELIEHLGTMLGDTQPRDEIDE